MSDGEDLVVSLEDIAESIADEKAIVMGGIDNSDCCTFIKGYMKRQAIYTCKTCLDISETRAGFCYPCLINCHDGHETIELYTKRNFRCDCGNSKFGDRKCSLWEEKDDENVENQYNSNFSNLYCICMRPYPDEDYEGNEEMIQCGICEDWYHVEHLNLAENERVKSSDEYEEMTCYRCLHKYPFLSAYASVYKHQLCIVKDTDPATPKECKRPRVDSPEHNKSFDNGTSKSCRLTTILSNLGMTVTKSQDVKNSDLGLNEEKSISSMFWPSSWRTKLCTCADCMSLYSTSKLKFLTDPEDTMPYYLKLGEQRAAEIDVEEDHALNNALSELPHPVAVTLAEGVGQLTKAIEEFLSQKRESGHVITEAEVRAFFDKFRSQRHS